MFQFILAGTQLEFGPMLRAQRMTRYKHLIPTRDFRENKSEFEDTRLHPEIDTPTRAHNAILPVLVLLRNHRNATRFEF